MLTEQVKPFSTNLRAGTLPLPNDFWRYLSLKSQVLWFLYFTGSNYPPVPSKCVFFPLFTGSKGLEISFFLSILQLVATWRYPSLHQLARCGSSIHGSVSMLLGYDLLRTCYLWLWRWFGSTNTIDASKKTWQISHIFSRTTKFLSETDMAGISDEEQFRVRTSKFLGALPLAWEFASHELYQRYWRGGEHVCTYARVCMWEPTTLLISVTTVPLLIPSWLLRQLTLLSQ